MTNTVFKLPPRPFHVIGDMLINDLLLHKVKDVFGPFFAIFQRGGKIFVKDICVHSQERVQFSIDGGKTFKNVKTPEEIARLFPSKQVEVPAVGTQL